MENKDRLTIYWPPKNIVQKNRILETKDHHMMTKKFTKNQRRKNSLQPDIDEEKIGPKLSDC